MRSQNRFLIRNELPGPLTLNIEPENVFISIGHGEEVWVVDVYTASPVSITVGQSGQGDPIVSVWPGDGEVRVEKDGVDILDGSAESKVAGV